MVPVTKGEVATKGNERNQDKINKKLTKLLKKTEFMYTIIYATLDSEEFKKRAKKESVGWFFRKLKDFNFAQHLFFYSRNGDNL